MVHGAFCGGWVFDDFAEPFRAAGHQVLTPDLPGHAATSPAGAVAGLSMSDYAKAIAGVAAGLDRPPVLLGHSMGGLVCLMAAGLVPTSGLVLLAPSPPWGVTGSTMEEAISAVSLYALGPFWIQSIEPDRAAFMRYCVDRLSPAERSATFRKVRRESGRAMFEVLNWWLDPFMTTSLRPHRIRAPVLALTGDRDVIHPPATVRETARRVNGEVRTLPGMSHWLPAEPGWRDIARDCVDWLAAATALAAR
jgi:pimeloyl-ACP methyl ester carboxylesterase